MVNVKWNEATQQFIVPEGECPSPTNAADISAKHCVQSGHCGCDEQGKPENQAPPKQTGKDNQ